MRAWLALLLILAGAAGAEPARPYRVTLLLYRGCEESCQAFQDWFLRQGVPVRFTLRDAAQDPRRIPAFVAETKRERPDLVVTWGTTVSLAALGRWDAVDPARHITDIPAVFMIVSQPLETGLVPGLDSSRRNITGSLYLLPLEEQIKAARTYLSFRRLGFLANPAEANSAASRDALQALAGKYGYQLVERTVDLDRAGKPVAATLAAKVAELAAAGADLLYLSPDTFLNINRQAVTGAALAHGLPVFAAAEAPVVQADALFGVVNRYDQVGRFTARQALRILRDGTAPAAIPVELPRRFSFLINLRVARQLGRYPPLPLLDIAEIVGDGCAKGPSCD